MGEAISSGVRAGEDRVLADLAALMDEGGRVGWRWPKDATREILKKRMKAARLQDDYNEWELELAKIDRAIASWREEVEKLSATTRGTFDPSSMLASSSERSHICIVL